MDIAGTGGDGDGEAGSPHSPQHLLDLEVMKIKISKPITFSLLRGRGSAKTEGPLRSHFPSGWDAIFKALLPPSNSDSMCLCV